MQELLLEVPSTWMRGRLPWTVVDEYRKPCLYCDRFVRTLFLRLADSMLLHKIFLGHVRDEKGAFSVLAWLRKILCFRV